MFILKNGLLNVDGEYTHNGDKCQSCPAGFPIEHDNCGGNIHQFTDIRTYKLVYWCDKCNRFEIDILLKRDFKKTVQDANKIKERKKPTKSFNPYK